jgi:hypothetical protein
LCILLWRLSRKAPIDVELAAVLLLSISVAMALYGHDPLVREGVLAVSLLAGFLLGIRVLRKIVEDAPSLVRTERADE